MVNFPGRNDRRRRVLKEELLSASGSRAMLRATSRDGATDDTPRYSDAAGVENHPQVTDFIPRRYGTIALIGLAGVGATIAAAALHYFVMPLAAARRMYSGMAIDMSARGDLSSWLAAVVLLLASGFCAMTYSIRRHRIDDYRGRYRVWRSAALACLVLSANSVVGLHAILADLLTAATGWSALRGDAVWWLAIGGLPLVWIYVRLLLDVRECRIGAILFCGAGVCYTVSAIAYLGYIPGVEPQIEPILVCGPLLLGHWLAFTAIVANARFVVLDAQGLVSVKRRAAQKRAPKVATKSAATKSVSTVSASASVATAPTRQTLQVAKTPADSSRWVDGSRPERDAYHDDDEDSSDGDRKLSKSERKRLRKMKTQGRAA